MAYKTHNDADTDIMINGCGLVGTINSSFQDLFNLFGKPTEGDGYKTDAEWHIRFDDGTISVVYNYKDGVNYNGERGTPVEHIKQWHVGGKSIKALYHVYDLLARSKYA